MENQPTNSAPMAPFVESYIKAFDELSAGPTIRHHLALVDVPHYRAQWEQMRRDIRDTIRYIGTLSDSDESHIRGVFNSATVIPFVSKTTSKKGAYEKNINASLEQDLNFLKYVTQDIINRGRELAHISVQSGQIQNPTPPSQFIVMEREEKEPWLTRNWAKLRSKIGLKAPENITQNDIDRKAMLLSARFGLDGISIQDEKSFSLAERSEKLDIAEKNMIESCRRIGIQEDQFGLGRNITVMFESLNSQLISNRSGFQQSIDGNENILMGFRPGSIGCEQTIVHEFTHSIDRHLAVQALLKKNVPLADISDVYFSDLGPKLQDVLPQAKEGLSQVFGITASPMPASEINELKAKSILKLSDKFMDELLSEIDDMSMTPKDRVELRAALNMDGGRFLSGVALGAVTSPIKSAISKNIYQSKQDDQVEVHPFIRKLKDMTGEAPVPLLQKCFGKVVSELADVAAVHHPLSKDGAPGRMLGDSIKKDMSSSNFEGNKLYQYWSKNTELFARLIGRPFDTTDSPVHPGSFTHHVIEPINPHQEAILNDGWKKILQSANLKLAAEPSLSQGNEYKSAGLIEEKTIAKRSVQESASFARRALLGIDNSKGLAYHRSPT